MDPRDERPDGLPMAGARGRGAGLNPGNRYETTRLSVLGEFLDEEAREHPDGRQVPTTVYADHTKRVINPVDSPDLAMEWTINPYRGCEHGCIYCYARPTHENLGFSSGLDFETKIVAKHDAPALLAAELDRPSWTGAPIVMSGVTDPYQPIERRLRITRGCLEVMAERRQPVSIITKSALVLRDLDLLTNLASHRAASVAVSVTTLDPALARRMEPRAASPERRLETIRALADAGLPVAVMAAPMIPGLNDREMASILKAARDAGAKSAGWTLLRLPHQVKAVFLDWLEREAPLRAKRVENAVRSTHGGDLYRSGWGVRRSGEGALAEQLKNAFHVFRRQYGYPERWSSLSSEAFVRRREERARQKAGPTLWDESSGSGGTLWA